MNLIAITGKAGSGKDTIATYIENKYANCYVEAFATPLKQACAAAFGIPIENFQDTFLKETDNDFWGVSPRMISQFVGTEMFRDMMTSLIPDVGKNFWVERMRGLIKGEIPTENGAVYTNEDTILISDLRFQNEYEFITSEKGIVLQVVKDGQEGNVGLSGHASEAGFETSADNTWLIYNDGTLEELYEEVEKALTAFNVNLYINTLVHRNSQS